MRNKIPPVSFFFLLLMTVVTADSQNFSYQAQLKQVKESGWHKIILFSEVISNSKNDLSDIRLFNSENREIPFVILNQNVPGRLKDSLIYTTVKKEFFTTENDTLRKITLLKFKFEKPQLLTKIIFYIDAPSYYFREARLYVNRTIETKRESRMVKDYFTSFSINSKNKLQFDLNNLSSRDFIIEIENNDNAPLGIIDVQLKQLVTFLVADLKENEKYILKFGDLKLRSPKYDISHFIDKNKKMPYLNLNDIETIPNNQAQPEPQPQSYWQKPWFLWSSIAVGAIILFFFSRSLIIEMRKK